MAPSVIRSVLFVILAINGVAAEEGLEAQYYPNKFLQGPPTATGIVPVIDFDWKSGAPVGLPNDGFSIRFLGHLTAPLSGDYTLTARTDDGVRLWVNGQLLINAWYNRAPTESSAVVNLQAGVSADIVMEYFENTGVAVAQLFWEGPVARSIIPSTAFRPVIPQGMAGGGSGLRGFYYADRDLTHLNFQRLDPLVKFNWSTGSPADSIPKDNFSIRWMGYFSPRFTEDVTLIAKTDDGVRLWVDGNLGIDYWLPQGLKDRTYTFPGVAGEKYLIVMEYKEHTGNAAAYLEWQSANEPRSARTTQLFPLERPVANIAAGSQVSPMFIQGVNVPGELPNILVQGQQVQAHSLSETSFWADVPLSDQGVVDLSIATVSGISTQRISWLPTDLEAGGSLTIRQGDSLLFTSSTGGYWQIGNQSGVFRAESQIAPMDLSAVAFASPGYYSATWTHDLNEPPVTTTITVVGVEFPKSIAAEVGYARSLTVPTLPAPDQVYIGANDSTLLAISPIRVGSTDLEVGAKPLRRGTPIVVARIHGPNGPIIRQSEINEFTLESKAIKTIVMFSNLETAKTNFEMRPYIEDIHFDFKMFSHKSTFAGGQKSLAVNTSEEGESGPVMAKIWDEKTQEYVGHMDIDLEIPVTESKYCFRWEGSQINSPRVKITTQKTVNGCACKIEAAGGIFVTPEANDEPHGTASSQGDERWIPQTRIMPVKDSPCAQGQYRLIMDPSVTCDPSGERGTADVNSGTLGSPVCLAQQSGPSPCQIDLMRFVPKCDLAWPPLSDPCQMCLDVCHEVPVHTGWKPQQTAITLIDCLSGKQSRVEKFFQVVRVDADGYTGSGDISTRDPIPKLTDSVVKSVTPPRSRLMSGVPIQISRIGKLEGALPVRVVSRAPSLVRISRESQLQIPENFGVSQLDSLLPDECLEFDLSGSDCRDSFVVYAYAVTNLSYFRNFVIEIQANETRWRCGAGGIEEVPRNERWVLADTVNLSYCLPGFPIEMSPIEVRGGDSYSSITGTFVPPSGSMFLRGSATDIDVCDGDIKHDTFDNYEAYTWQEQRDIGGSFERLTDNGADVKWVAPNVGDRAIIRCGAQDDGTYSLDTDRHVFLRQTSVVVYELQGVRVNDIANSPQASEVKWENSTRIEVRAKELADNAGRPLLRYELLEEEAGLVSSVELTRNSHFFLIPFAGRYQVRITNVDGPESERHESEEYVFYKFMVEPKQIVFDWEPEEFSVNGLPELHALGVQLEDKAKKGLAAVSAAEAAAGAYVDGYLTAVAATQEHRDTTNSLLQELLAAQEVDADLLVDYNQELDRLNASLARAERDVAAAQEALDAAIAEGRPVVGLRQRLTQAQSRLIIAGAARDTMVDTIAALTERIALRAVNILKAQSLIEACSSLLAHLSQANTAVKLKPFADTARELVSRGGLLNVIGIATSISSMVSRGGVIDEAYDAWTMTEAEVEEYRRLQDALSAGRKSPPLYHELTVTSVPAEVAFGFEFAEKTWITEDTKFQDASASHLTQLDGEFAHWDVQYTTESSGSKTFQLAAMGNLGRELIKVDKGDEWVEITSGKFAQWEALQIADELLRHEKALGTIIFELIGAVNDLFGALLGVLMIFAVFTGVGTIIVAGLQVLSAGMGFAIDWFRDWLLESPLEEAIKEQYPE